VIQIAKKARRRNRYHLRRVELSLEVQRRQFRDLLRDAEEGVQVSTETTEIDLIRLEEEESLSRITMTGEEEDHQSEEGEWFREVHRVPREVTEAEEVGVGAEVGVLPRREESTSEEEDTGVSEEDPSRGLLLVRFVSRFLSALSSNAHA